MANGRKNKNVIDHLVAENGEVVKEDSEIEAEVLAFFSKLYALVVNPIPFLVGLDWSPLSFR